MAKANLTAERLRELLHYNPDTGIFTWVASKKIVKDGNSNIPTFNKRYTRISVDGHNYRAHRLAWLYIHGSWPCHHIDHINGIKSNNSIANLRDVSPAINIQNMRQAIATSSSGLLGASFYKKTNKWLSQIKLNHKKIHLGYFDTAIEAHEAYVKAKRHMHVGCTI